MHREIAESPAVQTHVNIIQGIINRMASNSAQCKTWAVTIISAILVVLINNSRPDAISITYMPLGMFFLLDAFYLGLERFYREKYNSLVEQINSNDISDYEPYSISGPGFLEKISKTGCSLFSFSILPFYVILGVAIWLLSSAI